MRLFLAPLFVSSFLLGCSHVQDIKRTPAAVGVIGQDKEVLLYYKEGRYIVFKACDPIFIQGKTTEDAKRDCRGTAKKVSVEKFKRDLLEMVTTSLKKDFKPITSREVKAYKEDRANTILVEKMVNELEEINKFIEEHCESDELDAKLIRKHALLKALRSEKTLALAIRKINDQVKKAVDLIADDKKLTSLEYKSNKRNFLYTTLRNYEPGQIGSCGLVGSIDERIEDCSHKNRSKKEGFVLVTHKWDLNSAGEENGYYAEVYKDLSTGRLWSSPQQYKSNHFLALTLCKEGMREGAGIPGVKWRLPTISEYKEADKSGIRELPEMNDHYWTSSTEGAGTGTAWLFNGHSGEEGRAHQVYNKGQVRCVADVEN